MPLAVTFQVNYLKNQMSTEGKCQGWAPSGRSYYRRPLTTSTAVDSNPEPRELDIARARHRETMCMKETRSRLHDFANCSQTTPTLDDPLPYKNPAIAASSQFREIAAEMCGM